MCWHEMAWSSQGANLQVHFPFPAFNQEVLSEGFAEGIKAFLCTVVQFMVCECLKH